MSDRIFGFIIAVVALAFFTSATQLETPFISDPVGPKLFPYLVSLIAFIAALLIMYKPDDEPQWPKLKMFLRIIIAMIVLVIYAYLLRPLGFIIPTMLAAAILSYQINARILFSVTAGILLAIGLFVIFKYGLNLGLYAFPK